MFKNIMMVCVGNICRSPIAEALLKHQQPQLNVYSSGIGALVGKPADPKSVSLMANKNIDLSQHCAQQINALLVSNADLILTMEQGHIDTIQAKFPEARGKVHLIGKWNDNQEVPDPYKKTDTAFIAAAELIEAGIKQWQKKLWK